MKTLIGGAIAAALGLLGLAIWFGPFFTLIKGTIPAMLLLGGGLALYLGFDELKDTWKNDSGVDPLADAADDTVDQQKEEIENLKKEIEDLKSAKE